MIDLAKIEKLELLSNSNNNSDIMDLIDNLTDIRKFGYENRNTYEKILFKLLNNKDDDIRIQSAFTLSSWESPKFKKPLFNMMQNDKSPQVRSSCIKFYCYYYMSGTKDKKLIELLYSYILNKELFTWIRSQSIVGIIYIYYGKDNIAGAERLKLGDFGTYSKDEFFEDAIPWGKIKKILNDLNITF